MTALLEEDVIPLYWQWRRHGGNAIPGQATGSFLRISGRARVHDPNADTLPWLSDCRLCPQAFGEPAFFQRKKRGIEPLFVVRKQNNGRREPHLVRCVR